MSLATFPSNAPVTVTDTNGSTSVVYDKWYCPIFNRHVIGSNASVTAVFTRCFVDSNGNVNPCPATISPSVIVNLPSIASDSVLASAVQSVFSAWVVELMGAGTLT